MTFTPDQIVCLLKKYIDEDNNVKDEAECFKIIDLLENTQLSKDELEKTRIGKYVNEFRKKTTNAVWSKKAKNLIKKWQQLVGIDQQRQQSVQTAVTAGAGGPVVNKTNSINATTTPVPPTQPGHNTTTTTCSAPVPSSPSHVAVSAQNGRGTGAECAVPVSAESGTVTQHKTSEPQSDHKLSPPTSASPRHIAAHRGENCSPHLNHVRSSSCLLTISLQGTSADTAATAGMSPSASCPSLNHHLLTHTDQSEAAVSTAAGTVASQPPAEEQPPPAPTSTEKQRKKRKRKHNTISTDAGGGEYSVKIEETKPLKLKISKKLLSGAVGDGSKAESSKLSPVDSATSSRGCLQNGSVSMSSISPPLLGDGPATAVKSLPRNVLSECHLASGAGARAGSTTRNRPHPLQSTDTLLHTTTTPTSDTLSKIANTGRLQKVKTTQELIDSLAHPLESPRVQALCNATAQAGTDIPLHVRLKYQPSCQNNMVPGCASSSPLLPNAINSDISKAKKDMLQRFFASCDARPAGSPYAVSPELPEMSSAVCAESGGDTEHLPKCYVVLSPLVADNNNVKPSHHHADGYESDQSASTAPHPPSDVSITEYMPTADEESESLPPTGGGNIQVVLEDTGCGFHDDSLQQGHQNVVPPGDNVYAVRLSADHDVMSHSPHSSHHHDATSHSPHHDVTSHSPANDVTLHSPSHSHDAALQSPCNDVTLHNPEDDVKLHSPDHNVTWHSSDRDVQSAHIPDFGVVRHSREYNVEPEVASASPNMDAADVDIPGEDGVGRRLQQDLSAEGYSVQDVADAAEMPTEEEAQVTTYIPKIERQQHSTGSAHSAAGTEELEEPVDELERSLYGHWPGVNGHYDYRGEWKSWTKCALLSAGSSSCVDAEPVYALPFTFLDTDSSSEDGCGVVEDVGTDDYG